MNPNYVGAATCFLLMVLQVWKPEIGMGAAGWFFAAIAFLEKQERHDTTSGTPHE